MTLDKLNGIRETGMKERESNTMLERLLKDLEIFLDQEVHNNKYGNVIGNCMPKVTYNKLCDEINQKFPNLNEKYLTDLINTQINRETKTLQEELAIGVYTGILLSTIARKKKLKGEKAIFEFDGHDGKSNYLFTLARGFDVLSVKNFKGNIAYFLSPFKSIGILIAKNIDGEVFHNAALNHKLDCAIFENVRGYDAIGGISCADMIIARDCEGTNLLNFMGTDEVGLLIADKCKSKESFLISHNFERVTKANTVILSDIEIYDIFKKEKANGLREVKRLWLKNAPTKPNSYFNNAFDRIETLITDKNEPKLTEAQRKLRIKETINARKNPQKYESAVKKYLLQDVLDKSREINPDNLDDALIKIQELKKTYEQAKQTE